MGFAKVFRFIGIIIGLPMTFFGFIMRFPQFSNNLAEKFGLAVDEGINNFGLITLMMGGIILIIGIVCLIVTIKAKREEIEDRPKVTAFAEKEVRKYLRKYKKIFIKVATDARNNVVNSGWSCCVHFYPHPLGKGFRAVFDYHATSQTMSSNLPDLLYDYLTNALKQYKSKIHDWYTISVNTATTNYVKQYRY